MDEDTLYIEQFLNGDKKGFEILVRKYQDRVLNIVYSLVGNDMESEDIAQEVFLKVHNSLKSFKQHSRFSTWLYRIVVNTTRSFLRARKNVVSDEKLLENRTDTGKSPKDALSIKEREVIIKKAVAKVPIKFRTAMILKDIEGLNYKEIAGVLRCRMGTVESKIYRARQFLKEELIKLGGEAI
ncbi:MAG: sigma-70 family RNA polymerase sigma factor [Candidatus Omnitrophota bacterium]